MIHPRAATRAALALAVAAVPAAAQPLAAAAAAAWARAAATPAAVAKAYRDNAWGAAVLDAASGGTAVVWYDPARGVLLELGPIRVLTVGGRLIAWHTQDPLRRFEAAAEPGDAGAILERSLPPLWLPPLAIALAARCDIVPRVRSAAAIDVWPAATLELGSDGPVLAGPLPDGTFASLSLAPWPPRVLSWRIPGVATLTVEPREPLPDVAWPLHLLAEPPREHAATIADLWPAWFNWPIRVGERLPPAAFAGLDDPPSPSWHPGAVIGPASTLDPRDRPASLVLAIAPLGTLDEAPNLTALLEALAQGVTTARGRRAAQAGQDRVRPARFLVRPVVVIDPGERARDRAAGLVAAVTPRLADATLAAAEAITPPALWTPARELISTDDGARIALIAILGADGRVTSVSAWPSDADAIAALLTP